MAQNAKQAPVTIPGDHEMKIALGATFSDACKMLPKEIRAKVAKAQAQFFSGPFAMGLHQEKIQGADSDIYSCRLDQNYRIIYKRPEGHDVVFFLYVGSHDEAYQWASTHCCGVNPITGAIQTAAAVTAKVIREPGKPKPAPRLSKLTDEQLKKLGIPDDYWEQLRTKIFLAGQLVGYKSLLTEATYAVLEEIVGGMSVNDAMDLFDAFNEPVNIPEITARPDTVPMFDALSDEDLVSVSIPAEYLDLVRTVRTEPELSGLAGKLPEEAMQSLYALRSGETIEAIRKATFSDSKPVEPDDFAAALANPITQSQFAVMEDEAALHAFMEAPMDKWRVFLHPTQRRLVEHHYAGPARITGGAGTGKTVVIVHRAKFLAKQCTGDEKVLVTTYSTTLADDIAKRLASICTQEELARIEVTTVDAVARRLAAKRKISIKYNWTAKHGSAGDLDKLWAEAIGASGREQRFGIDFFLAEWQDVIQAQQINSLERYMTAQRGSRGKRLDKRNREDVWAVFEQYRQLCDKRQCADIDYAENQIAQLCAEDPLFTVFLNYRFILVDECQDLRAPAYRMLRAIAGPQHQDDLYFSGDSRQRIYHGQASLSQCGIVVNNRSSMLKLNYRTTSEIYEAAMRVQQGYQYDDLDGKALEQDKCVCIFHGEKPLVRGFDTLEAEMDAIAEDIKKRIEAGIPENEICVMNRLNKWCYGCEKGLNQRGITALVLNNSQADDPSIPGVRIATMHRVKGMEFSCVYIIGASSANMPPKDMLNRAETEEERQELMKQEANLLSVAMTRAKQIVWITYEKTPSLLLDRV